MIRDMRSVKKESRSIPVNHIFEYDEEFYLVVDTKCPIIEHSEDSMLVLKLSDGFIYRVSRILKVTEVTDYNIVLL